MLLSRFADELFSQNQTRRELPNDFGICRAVLASAPVLVRYYFGIAPGILYLSCTRAVLILYLTGCFWPDFQGVLKIFSKYFPQGRGPLRKSLPPQCSRISRLRSLQVTDRNAGGVMDVTVTAFMAQKWVAMKPALRRRGISCMLKFLHWRLLGSCPP